MSAFPGECSGSMSVRGGTHATRHFRGWRSAPNPSPCQQSLPSPQPQVGEPASFREDAGCGGGKEAGRLALCQGGAGEALGFSLFWRRSQPRQPGPLPPSLLSSAAGEGREGAQGAPGEGLPLRKTGAKALLQERGTLGNGSQRVPSCPWALPRWALLPYTSMLPALPPDTAGLGTSPTEAGASRPAWAKGRASHSQAFLLLPRFLPGG